MKASVPMKIGVWSPSPSRLRAAEREQKRAGTRPRPDVSGYFAVAVVCALASGFFFLGDLIHMRVPLAESLSFALAHPMSYILACCVALVAGLLAVGDV